MIYAFVKIPLFLFALLSYIGISITGDFFIRNKQKKLRFFSKTTSIACRLALKILAIRVKVINFNLRLLSSHQLFVSNHMSYLDIMILSSIMPSLYITSVEVEKTFFLGLMSKLGGSLFVERRSKTKLLEEIDRIASVLKMGFSVTLFPEGTSSNGEKVLPFKGALFSTAENAGVPIQPICIKYELVNGKPVTAKNRDLLYYYGDIVFFPHLVKLFFVGKTDVSVTFLDKINTEGQERKVIADRCFNSIAAAYNSQKIYSCHGAQL